MRRVDFSYFTPLPATRRLLEGIAVLILTLSLASCGSSGSDTSEWPATPLGNDASLSSLSISAATLEPAFDASVTDYTASVPVGTETIDVFMTPSDSGADITINGGVDTTIALSIGSNTISILVTAEDGTRTQTYTVMVTRPASSNANLSGLESSDVVLEPPFSPSGQYFIALVGPSVDATQVIAIAEDPNASILVNGAAVDSGEPGDPIALKIGINKIDITVTAEDSSQRVYQIEVIRLSALLIGLELTDVVLDPPFSPFEQTYRASVTFAVETTQLIATVEGPNATVRLSGLAITSGEPTDPIPLRVGRTYITPTVIDENGGQRPYRVSITRAASDNVFLSNLELSDVVLEPAFDPNQNVYSASVGSGVNATRVTAATGDIFAAIRVNGNAIVSGATSEPIDLQIGGNTITVNVTAEDGVTTRTYTIVVTRYAADNANLSSLALTNLVLDSAFNPDQLDYTATVGFGANSTQVIATTENPNAAIRVNGTNVSSSEFSDPIALDEGSNTIRVDVTSEDGAATKAYILAVTRQNVSAYAQAAYVKATGTSPGDWFGASIALSGNGGTLAVGAPYVNDFEGNKGAAYLYTRANPGVWASERFFGGGLDDRLGSSVALSEIGATLAVGAETHTYDDIEYESTDLASKSSSPGNGAAFVFTRDGTGVWWGQAYLDSIDSWELDAFGRSVAMSDDGWTVAAGVPLEDSASTGVDGDETDNSAGNSGAVYVFARDGEGVWSRQAYIKASNTGSGDEFGHSVALSADGMTLAVGAWKESSAAAGVNGDEFDNDATEAGAVYLFNRDDAGGWAQQAYVKALNTDSRDRFGASVALSDDGSVLAVGAWGEDSAAVGINGDATDNTAPNSGAVYVFNRDTGAAWTQQAYIKASRTDAEDLLGYSVALSSGGTMLAAGVRGDDSAATGANGDAADNSATDSGAAYVFIRDGDGDWSESNFLKASNTDAGDFFGRSVALSDDGRTLAIGAGGEDSAATGVNGDQTDNTSESSGAAYVFEMGEPRPYAGLTFFNDRGEFDQAAGPNQEVEDFESFETGDICPITDPPRTTACELITDTVTYTSNAFDELAEEGSQGIRLRIEYSGPTYGNYIWVPNPIPSGSNDFLFELDSQFLGFDFVRRASTPLTVEITESDGVITRRQVSRWSSERNFFGLVSEVGVVSVSIWDDPDDGGQSNFGLDDVAVQHR